MSLSFHRLPPKSERARTRESQVVTDRIDDGILDRCARAIYDAGHRHAGTVGGMWDEMTASQKDTYRAEALGALEAAAFPELVTAVTVADDYFKSIGYKPLGKLAVIPAALRKVKEGG